MKPNVSYNELFRTMKPAFSKGGTVTAANASPISDGGTLLSSKRFLN